MQQFMVSGVVAGNCRVLVCEGELDQLTVPVLEDALAICVDGMPVIVDLTDLTFLDSTGIHALLQKRQTGQPAALVRRRVSVVNRVLEIVQADQAILVFETVDDAVALLDQEQPQLQLRHS